jgi:hypothetical protein
MEKFYVDENNQANIICYKCGFEKSVDATNYRNTKNKVKGKCKCIEGFEFTLEYRKHYRKDVKLPGEYIAPKNGEKGEIIIRELSLTGIQFESLKPHQISSDDTLEVTFKLDNPPRSKIRKPVKVMWVRDRSVGAQFSERKLYEKDLGFYLQK